MAETVKLPGLGEVKTQYVWAGGALVVGIVGVAWYRAAADGDAAEVSYDADDVVPEDEWEPPTAGAGTDTIDVDDTDRAVPTTNAQWTQMATNRLANFGWDTQLVSRALGKYLTRRLLGAKEAAAVRAAVGVAGYPPVGGAARYPIRLLPGGKDDDEPKPKPKPKPKPRRKPPSQKNPNKPGRRRRRWPRPRRRRRRRQQQND